MTTFLLCAVLLLALAISFLAWPLLRGGVRGAGRDRGIVSLYRDKLRELNADHAAGTISAEQLESGRRDLERRLLEDIGQPASAPGVSRPARLTAAGLGAFVLVVPIALYLALGTPAAINPLTSDSQVAGGTQEAEGGDKAAPHPITPEQVQAMIDQLAKRLEQSPRDGEGWAMLARSYSYVRKFPEAVKAYQKATELLPNDSHLLADYADALAMTQERRLEGAPMKLIQRALAIDAKDIKALALAGSEAFDRRDYKAAIGYWDRALKAGPPDPQFVQQLQAGLNEARQLTGGAAPPPPIAEATPPPQVPAVPAPAARDPAAAVASGPAASAASVKGRVELAATLAGKAAPTDTLFVFARATQGPRMPLALLKRQVKDLPLEFALDDSMSMMPTLKLSNFSSVVIGARVSKAGDAMPASGDLQGFSSPVKVGSSGVDVRIDQVVP
jgi:cytochrome c-type biogenesis protein CcmH